MAAAYNEGKLERLWQDVEPTEYVQELVRKVVKPSMDAVPLRD